MIFKCKMCGGALEVNNNESVVECQYCGTQQTLPKLNDERRANLYDRANHFRRNNEFDKATGIYEQILNEDKTDAETYWSLVLCRYGIEYVEDPSSHKRIPTVNRAQYTSVFDDDNYKSALQYADSYQRGVYEKEAKAINEIQRSILAISQKEEPFDIFICYKETDHNGRRTPDSVLANELYHQLTQEGFKVFFSRITLEDKLGSAYEPYIFAALNSAKVMVVLGTKSDYFKATWVRNEWSRYLALIKQGQQKILIPAYRDMDPYDLPEEFSHLQAQDMSKLGFMQDLIRGIKKIVQVETVEETATIVGNVNTAALVKRVFMFLEDEEWSSADEYCERILDADPECAEAYVGKLMSELRVRKQNDLKNLKRVFSNNKNYQKACKFANEELRTTLEGYINAIVQRNLTDSYERAVNAMTIASNENDYKMVASQFESMGIFRDAKSKAAICLEEAEKCRKEAIYVKACSLMSKATIVSYEEAINKFEEIEDWKDALLKKIECQGAIADIKEKEEEKRGARRKAQAEKEEQARLEQKRREEAERFAREQEIAKELSKKRQKKAIAIIAPIVGACIIFIIVLITVIIPNGKYKDAMALKEQGKDVQACQMFLEIEPYKDVEVEIQELALHAVENKTELFRERDIIPRRVFMNNKELSYKYGIALLKDDQLEESRTYFKFCEKFEDSSKYIKYVDGRKSFDAGSWDETIKLMNSIKGFNDANKYLDDARYQKVVTSHKMPLEEALSILQEITDKTETVESFVNMLITLQKCNTEYKFKSASDGKTYNNVKFEFFVKNGKVYVDPKFVSSGLTCSECEVQPISGEYQYYFSSPNGGYTSGPFDTKFWITPQKVKADMPGYRTKPIAYYTK